MKIAEIRVESYGIWNNLTLPVRSPGVNVLFGPNEAGKSTLLRFIRGMLFGFEPPGKESAAWVSPTNDQCPIPPTFATLDIGHWSLVNGHSLPGGQCPPYTSAVSGSLLVEVAGRRLEIAPRFPAIDESSRHAPRADSDYPPPPRPAAPAAQRDDSAAADGTRSVPVTLHEGSAEAILEQWLSDASSRLFESVFAVGLAELRELATLHDEEVAARIYGLSLGPDGRRLLEALAGIEQERKTLFNAEARTGELIHLLEQDDELAGEIEADGELRDRRDELVRERQRLLAGIDELKRRQAGMDAQLKGHRFLERVHGPWKQLREYEEELRGLPQVTGFPEDGLARLKEIDEELASLTRCRDTLLAEAAEFRQAAGEQPVDRELARHASAVRGLLDQRGWLRDQLERHTAAQAQAAERRAALDERLEQLGPVWNVERLAGVDCSPAAHFRLADAARMFRDALARRARFRRKYKRESQACHKRHAALEEKKKQLGGFSPAEALAEAKSRLAQLHDGDDGSRSRQTLARLRGSILRAVGVAGAGPKGRPGARNSGARSALTRPPSRLSELTVDSSQLSVSYTTGNAGSAAGEARHCQLSTDNCQLTRLELPRWVYVVLGGFGVAGIVFAILGVVLGITSSALAGTAYALLGFTCGGVAWALRSHFDGAVRQGQEQLLAGEIARLERMVREEERLRERRRRLSRMRARLQNVHRGVGEARRRWCETLAGMGLEETVRIQEAFDNWQRLCEAAQAAQALRDAEEDAARHQRWIESLTDRVAELARRFSSIADAGSIRDADAALELLDLWEQQLETLQRHRAERRRLRREEKVRRREAAGYRSRIKELKTQRSALLVQGGAAGREEFEMRAEWVERRRDLGEYLELARAELEEAAANEPDLAIVEEDLLAFDAAENAAAVQTLKAELREIEADLHRSHEQLGILSASIDELEADRSSSELRQQRAELSEHLVEASERWLAAHQAGRALDRVRSQFERSCQPAVLAAASEYLRQLTAGRYVNVWTPLGRRHPCVDDSCGRTLAVEELSGGTREQLFLAIRLALIGELSSQGVELPLILDDVLVNFDRRRCEAAVETLLRFAEGGRQILLFTCHEHLVGQFTHRGVEPIRLPEWQQPEAPAESWSERLAG